MCGECDGRMEKHRCDCGNLKWVQAYQDGSGESQLFRCTKCDQLQEMSVAKPVPNSHQSFVLITHRGDHALAAL
jgi:hypothetical protein